MSIMSFFLYHYGLVVVWCGGVGGRVVVGLESLHSSLISFLIYSAKN